MPRWKNEKTDNQPPRFDQNAMEEKMKAALKETFPPEFLNRVDRLLFFQPLSEEAINKIVDVEITKLCERIKEHRVNLDISPTAKKEIARLGFDAEQGARPLRRVIQKHIEDVLAEMLLSENFKDGDVLRVHKNQKGLRVCLKNPYSTASSKSRLQKSHRD